MRLVAPSFRTRILLVVLTVAVVPLALIGLWLTGSASRSGEELLRSRLEEGLDRTVARVGNNWLRLRSDLLFLGEDEEVQRVLKLDPARRATDETPPPGLLAMFQHLDAAVSTATILDGDGRILWAMRREDDQGRDARSFEPGLHVALPIHERFPARQLGMLEAEIQVGVLLGNTTLTSPLAGQVMGAFDANRGTALLALPFDQGYLDKARFEWGDDEWMTARRQMSDPPLNLVVAAPLSPFAGPFEDAARQGTWMLAVVAVSGLLAAYLLSRRLTRSLERLAAAAEAVSHGELEAQIEGAGTDEVGRVAHAFNTMTASLRRTIRELADRERLAAVGEFAASLAHEVRNPLTAIRIDLQRVEERLPGDSPLRAPQARALREISRLDATVSETLEVARTGRWPGALIDLTAPLRAAAEAAAPAFDEHNATLDTHGLDHGLPVMRADAKALEQLVLNLLLNAAAALDAGGRAWIEVEEEAQHAVISIRDTGAGIDPGVLDRVFEPLYTSRSDGTGLGLTVARRIVDQHGGTIGIESAVGEGTTVRVRLPLGI